MVDGAVVYLSREVILATQDLPEEVVEVPEWGGNVLIRGVTKAKQLDIRAKARDPETGELDSAKLEMGLLAAAFAEPAFTLDDMPALAEKSAAALDRCLIVATRLNSGEAKAIENAKREFPAEAGEPVRLPARARSRSNGRGAASQPVSG